MSKARRKSTDARLLDYMGQRSNPRFGRTTPKQRRRMSHKAKRKLF